MSHSNFKYRYGKNKKFRKVNDRVSLVNESHADATFMAYLKRDASARATLPVLPPEFFGGVEIKGEDFSADFENMENFGSWFEDLPFFIRNQFKQPENFATWLAQAEPEDMKGYFDEHSRNAYKLYMEEELRKQKEEPVAKDVK